MLYGSNKMAKIGVAALKGGQVWPSFTGYFNKISNKVHQCDHSDVKSANTNEFDSTRKVTRIWQRCHLNLLLFSALVRMDQPKSFTIAGKLYLHDRLMVTAVVLFLLYFTYQFRLLITFERLYFKGRKCLQYNEETSWDVNFDEDEISFLSSQVPSGGEQNYLSIKEKKTFLKSLNNVFLSKILLTKLYI